jgi:hypothetical protein
VDTSALTFDRPARYLHVWVPGLVCWMNCPPLVGVQAPGRGRRVHTHAAPTGPADIRRRTGEVIDTPIRQQTHPPPTRALHQPARPGIPHRYPASAHEVASVILFSAGRTPHTPPGSCSSSTAA